jgi:membrane protease YdiL (CAAX protease family)
MKVRALATVATASKHVGLGLAVMVAVTVPWSALALLNLRLSARLPWAIPLGIAYVGAAASYLNGSGWPKSTSAPRKRGFRAHWLAVAELNWALLAGMAAVAALWFLYAASGELAFQARQSSEAGLPTMVLLSATIIAAAVAAVAEEGGLRGFMQAPLERLLGPAAAIATTSIFFVLIHLSHGFAALVRNAPFYFAAGCVYGLLAYLTQSILPSLILHFLGDILVFALRSSLVHFGIPRESSTKARLVAAAVLLAGASLAAFFRLARLTSTRRSQARVADDNMLDRGRTLIA